MCIRIKEIPNSRIIHCARVFANSANLLKELGKDLDVAVIVNATFAIELYLKSFDSKIRFEEPEDIKGGVTLYNKIFVSPVTKRHELTKLFESLPRDIKLIIEDEYYSAGDKKLFSTALQEFDDVFVNWRYIFEKSNCKMIDLSALFYLLSLMERVADKLAKKSTKP